MFFTLRETTAFAYVLILPNIRDWALVQIYGARMSVDLRDPYIQRRHSALHIPPPAS